MLFLVSGASGMGKSSVRERVAPGLGTAFQAVELADLGSLENITVARRQELAEVAAARAAKLAVHGQHLLLSGDPVAAAEIIAVPSAIEVGGIAVCILDADAATQTERLTGRGDPAEYLHLHLGFAEWMREHAIDPMPRLDVLKASGSPIMAWERVATLATRDPRWRVTMIDTSARSIDAVATKVRRWIDLALGDDTFVMHPEQW